MKIGIYAGHSGGAGGGEAHSAGFINILQDYYDVTVMLDPGKFGWKDEVKSYFGYDLSRAKWEALDINLIPTFDQFININHGLILPPLARRNIILCFYPQYIWDTSGYDTILTNSYFTKKQIVERWNRHENDIHVIYPSFNLDRFKYQESKRNAIMTIGRFFDVPDGNNKNHLVMIDAFKKIHDPNLKFFIVGSVQNSEYYLKVRKAAESDPRIVFYSDLHQDQLTKMYSDCKIYWHAAGYQAELPSGMEHFGMASIEAMASGTIPIVHNSGGMPESGAATWETPEELVEKTLFYLKNKERINFSSILYRTVKEKFSPEITKKLLIDVIEKPIAIFRPEEESNFQKPPVEITVNPKEITVGIIGDAPNLTTGFGLVEKMIGLGFLKAGFNVTQIGLQDINHEPRMDDKWRIWRPGPQAISPEMLQNWIQKDKPNVLWLNYDAGNISDWCNKLSSFKCDIPVIAYFPIEGFPIPSSFINLAKLIATPVTYLNWGADLIYEQSNGLKIDWVPHGLDHAKFERFDEARRQKLKDDIGWGNKFVIGAFGRNKRTKQQPRIIETVRILKDQEVENIVLYLHCQQFEGHMMNGWALDQIVEYNGVGDQVCFPPNAGFSQIWGIDYEKTKEIPESAMKEIDWENDPMAQAKARSIILSSYSMIERYNMCDLFITMSQAEGFNLPLGEAMACGVPVISVDDSGSQKEVAGGAAEFIKPVEWDTWHIGTLLPIVSKKELANKIALIMANPLKRKEMSDASLEKAQQYKWDETCDKMNSIVIKTYLKDRP